jgi:hypothetical protein
MGTECCITKEDAARCYKFTPPPTGDTSACSATSLADRRIEIAIDIEEAMRCCRLSACRW